MSEDATVVCASCGAPGPDDESQLVAWTRGVERGRTVWMCPRCVRENLRSIEAKLERGFW
ncbi:MAG TPA: hypothetical protein VFL94_12990 [Actinomycetales bacterium]|nr:hypothetical protein [Actinomycetales bacterium]